MNRLISMGLKSTLMVANTSKQFVKLNLIGINGVANATKIEFEVTGFRI